MVTHLVLFTPRVDLDADGQRELARTFEQAVATIPSVRRVRVGRRVRHGAGYESASGAAQFVAAIDFDDLEGLRAYLRHPAHERLGRLFRESLLLSEVYDFETGGLDVMADLMQW